MAAIVTDPSVSLQGRKLWCCGFPVLEIDSPEDRIDFHSLLGNYLDVKLRRPSDGLRYGVLIDVSEVGISDEAAVRYPIEPAVQQVDIPPRR